MLDNDIKFIKNIRKYSSEERFLIFLFLSFFLLFLFLYYAYPENDSLGELVLLSFFYFYATIIDRKWFRIINELLKYRCDEKDMKFVKRTKKHFSLRKLWFILFIIFSIIYMYFYYNNKYMNIPLFLSLIFSSKTIEIFRNRKWLKIIDKYYDIEKMEPKNNIENTNIEKINNQGTEN